jgi:aminoglycoside 3-N-acetyltransferase
MIKSYINSNTKLSDDLLKLGIIPGGTLLVHASLKSLGEITGGPEAIIQALLDTIGCEGTLLMPALSFATVNEANPYFDQHNTPSCIGALPEYFRKRLGTLRSLHPTHSVAAYGSKAQEIIKGHQLDTTPCGPHSPFRRLRQLGGQILMLGCGMAPNTSMHAIEEVAESPYLLKTSPTSYNVTSEDASTTLSIYRHNFAGHYLQRYDRLEPLLPANAIKTGMVLKAKSHLIDCRLMWEVALNKMHTSPYYFVTPA